MFMFYLLFLSVALEDSIFLSRVLAFLFDFSFRWKNGEIGGKSDGWHLFSISANFIFFHFFFSLSLSAGHERLWQASQRTATSASNLRSSPPLESSSARHNAATRRDGSFAFLHLLCSCRKNCSDFFLNFFSSFYSSSSICKLSTLRLLPCLLMSQQIDCFVLSHFSFFSFRFVDHRKNKNWLGGKKFFKNNQQSNECDPLLLPPCLQTIAFLLQKNKKKSSKVPSPWCQKTRSRQARTTPRAVSPTRWRSCFTRNHETRH